MIKYMYKHFKDMIKEILKAPFESGTSVIGRIRRIVALPFFLISTLFVFLIFIFCGIGYTISGLDELSKKENK
ncbi:MAG: hypothetical protein AABY32_02085 [Nanoarchaeota archaeon]